MKWAYTLGKNWNNYVIANSILSIDTVHVHS